jgi:putative serine protease PepD
LSPVVGPPADEPDGADEESGGASDDRRAADEIAGLPSFPDHVPFDLLHDLTDDQLDPGAPATGPLPPDDRLWRHPSELATAGLPAAATPPPPSRGRDRARRRPPSRPAGQRPREVTLGQRLVAVGLAGGVGALLTAGVLVASGQLSHVQTITQMPTVTSSLVVDRRTSLVDGDGAAAVVARVQRGVLAVSATRPGLPTTRGSATLVRQGYAVTALRVVDGATALTLHIAGEARVAHLVGSDPETDLALLSIEGTTIEGPAIGRSSSLRPGDTAVSITAPPGATGTHSVTVGVVSALDRPMVTGKMVVRGALQLDRPVPAEGAGGALVDAAGNLIGITLPAAETAAPFGYAIPIDAVAEVARQLILSGHVARPWLGIEGGDDEATGGAGVWQVRPTSPAARAGVQVGDVVLAIDDVPVASMDAMIRMLRTHTPGETVRLHLKRKDQLLDLAVTLAEK